MKLELYTKSGLKKEDKEYGGLPSFEGTRGVPALRQVVLSYLANRRIGSACTKTRAEVSGTGKKPYRQKGTGMARHGSKRSPIWRKGGVVFGPKPRDYSQKINKKMKTLAFSRAFFDLCSTNRLVVIEEWSSDLSKTSTVDKVIRGVFPVDNSVLLIDVSASKTFVMASRNLSYASIASASELNALDLVSYKKFIVSEAALSVLLSRISC